MARPKPKKKEISARVIHASKQRERKAAMRRYLNSIAADVEAIKSNNNGKIPYGSISALVAREKPLLPWLTTTHVFNHLRRLNTNKSMLDTVNATHDSLATSALSTITAPSATPPIMSTTAPPPSTLQDIATTPPATIETVSDLTRLSSGTVEEVSGVFWERRIQTRL